MALAEEPGAGEPITIKKYANRRLYNTATSSYVTLDDLSVMVKDGQDFVVYDAKTGEDITRSVLTQIIFEEESKGSNLLPIQFLRQLIRFYGDNLESFVPSYLEMSLDMFTKNQDQWRTRMSDTLGGGAAYNMFEDQIRQNIALFDRAMKMFMPFSNMYGDQANDRTQPSQPPQPPQSAPGGDEMSALKAQIDALQKRLDDIGDK